ncbi:hypothetical protein OA92_08770 [Marinomonas sp. SBI22]|nr:hypothetical protein OA91_23535 [Marinomonas sp. SBI8L]KZM43752.1 hypothetical protein OA92_08770 [Marinomonas sp. SBI22]
MKLNKGKNHRYNSLCQLTKKGRIKAYCEFICLFFYNALSKQKPQMKPLIISLNKSFKTAT